MADLRFHDWTLTLARHDHRMNVGYVIADQFEVTKEDGYYIDLATHVLHDKKSENPCLLYTMRCDYDNGYRESNFLQFLSECAGIPGWPKLITSIRLGNGRFSGIITTYQGERMRTIFHRTFAISYPNAVRLCYQLFALLDTMHSRGFVHRAIDVDSIRGRVTWDDEFIIGLNSFRYTTRKEPAPQCYGMRWAYSSIYVNENQPFTPVDDFISVLYVILTSQGLNMFQNNSGHAMRMKQAFHRNPHAFLTDRRLHWIADLYEMLVHQRENGFNRELISARLNSAVVGCVPSSPLEWSPVSPDSSDVKLNANPVLVGPPRQEPIRVPHD